MFQFVIKLNPGLKIRVSVHANLADQLVAKPMHRDEEFWIGGVVLDLFP